MFELLVVVIRYFNNINCMAIKFATKKIIIQQSTYNVLYSIMIFAILQIILINKLFCLINSIVYNVNLM